MGRTQQPFSSADDRYLMTIEKLRASGMTLKEIGAQFNPPVTRQAVFDRYTKLRRRKALDKSTAVR